MPGVSHIWLMATAASSGFPISTNGQDVPLPPPSLITDSNAMQTKYTAHFRHILSKLSPFRRPL